MKNIFTPALLAFALFLGGCAHGMTPVTGFAFTQVSGPLAATDIAGSKTGMAKCQSILGLVALGDCSVDAAKKDGGITTVSSVDYKNLSILGIFTELTTVVKGS
jgi:hypothetical protein